MLRTVTGAIIKVGVPAVIGAAGALYAYLRYQEQAKISRRAQALCEVIEAEIDDPDGQGTPFQRFILAEFRARHGVPTYTAANLVMARRVIHALLKEHREHMRGVDLEKHTREIVTMAFVPAERDVLDAQVLGNHPSWFARWIAPNPATEQMAALRRPPA